jgi:hypothetical protein
MKPYPRCRSVNTWVVAAVAVARAVAARAAVVHVVVAATGVPGIASLVMAVPGIVFPVVVAAIAVLIAAAVEIVIEQPDGLPYPSRDDSLPGSRRCNCRVVVGL